MKEQPVDFRLRLMRMTSAVKRFAENQLQFFQQDGDVLVNMDMTENVLANRNMPTMNQVSDKLRIEEEDIENSGFFFQGHHGRRPATLGVFWHKVQDNMPIALIEGRDSKQLPPLINKKNEEQIRVQY